MTTDDLSEAATEPETSDGTTEETEMIADAPPSE
jgi:hypothetical protein